jgi:membrane protein DedA with SNARE-associated domain
MPPIPLYLSIVLAAAVEGEIVFVAAAAAVSQGRLHPIAVILAGALGAALGDQFYFYLLRGRVDRWIARVPAISRRARWLEHRVRQHEAVTIVAIRFSPGLRIALAAACAYARVSRLKFSVLNALSALVWATGLLVLVAVLGPAVLTRLGVSGWWAALVPAAAIVVVVRWMAHAERTDVDAQTTGEQR